jgi:hypothetical protein
MAKLKPCKSCGKEVAKSAKACPNCGQKLKLGLFKKALIVFGVFIAIGVIASLGEEDSDTAQPANTEPKVEETEVAPKEEAKEEKKKEKEKEDTPKEEKKSFGIGETVPVGDMIYTVNERGSADQVGPSVLPTKASGKYLVINVSLKNNGNEAVTVDTNFFKLKRDEKTYDADSMASISANQGESGDIANSFFLQQLNPDMEITGKVVFDLAPEVAEAQDLQLQIQTGFWGTETELINLQ